MHADDLLSSLDPEQREVATALRGPVRVLAGAGTGKTRAITHRIAYGVAAGVYNPTEVLAVTFTTRAAGEMRTRLRAMGAGCRPGPHLPLRGAAPGALLLAEGLRRCAARADRVEDPVRRGRRPPQPGRGQPGDCCATWPARSSGPRSATCAPTTTSGSPPRRGREVSGLDAGTVAHVFGSYEELKRDQGRMDMEDVLLIGAALLSEDERVAAEVRRQYKWFVVDEFQDVSPIQSALLDLWLGGRDEICVVGDPAQTIYSFAGAQASYLTEFTEPFPGATSVELVRNYRSTPAGDRGGQHPAEGVGDHERPAARPAGGRPGADAGARPPTRSTRPRPWPRRWAGFATPGCPLREMAVLFRINAQSEAFEEALTARGIPYVVRGAARFFERQEVRQALALLRGEARAGEAADRRRWSTA